MFCSHDLSNTFDDKICGGIFSVLTKTLPYNGLPSLRNLTNLPKNTVLIGSKRI